MKLTNEQKTILNAINKNQVIKVNAFAGAGKTTTLVEIAKANPQLRFLYLAFNKAIVNDVSLKLPKNAVCKTFHGLAFAAMRSTYDAQKMTTSISPYEIFDISKEVELNIYFDLISAHAVINTLKDFCYSNDTEILKHHVPIPIKYSRKEKEFIENYQNQILKVASLAWSRMIDPSTMVALGFDGYFKVWTLQKPKLQYDCILIDEAQDINPCFAGLIEDQDCKVILIGDQWQQIYEWRKSINLMKDVSSDVVFPLTQSFRFGSNIAKFANQALSKLGETRPLVHNGQEVINTVPKEFDVHLFRTNSAMLVQAVNFILKNKRVYAYGGIKSLQRYLAAIEGLLNGKPSNLPEFFGFKDWNEVVNFVEESHDQNLGFLVSLVDKFGIEKLSWIIGKLENEPRNAEVLVSTIHQSKGQEWDNVRIDESFEIDTECQDVPEEEIRLLYVAVTRAKRNISVPPLLEVFLNNKLSLEDYGVTEDFLN